VESILVALSRVNQQVDFLRQHIGDFADEVAAEQIGHGVAAGRAENEARRVFLNDA
jgi:hypothetical protein